MGPWQPGNAVGFRELVVVGDDDVDSEGGAVGVMRAECRELSGDVTGFGGEEFALATNAADSAAEIEVPGHRHLVRSPSPLPSPVY